MQTDIKKSDCLITQPQRDYMVLVRCFTYNHSQYITDALNGFVMQKTNFPYVCLIVDDASTDGEQNVIMDFLQKECDIDYAERTETGDYLRIKAPHKTNSNCTLVVFFLKDNHKSQNKDKYVYVKPWRSLCKYEAWCEGDDYWTEPRKLQLQVDFMESHPEHSLCIHAYRQDLFHGNSIVSKEIHKYSSDVEIIPDKDVFNYRGMFSATASMLYRTSARDNYPEWAKKAPVGDRPLKFVLFSRGHIAYLDRMMSVYRIGVQGSWTNRIARNHKEEKKTREKFIQLLNDFDEWTNRKYHNLTKSTIIKYRILCKIRDVRYFFHKLLSLP